MPRKTTLPAHERVALSLPDAAAALDLSPDTLKALIDAGQIPLVTFRTPAGTYMKRIMWDDLTAFCLRNRDPYPLPTVTRKRTPLH